MQVNKAENLKNFTQSFHLITHTQLHSGVQIWNFLHYLKTYPICIKFMTAFTFSVLNLHCQEALSQDVMWFSWNNRENRLFYLWKNEFYINGVFCSLLSLYLFVVFYVFCWMNMERNECHASAKCAFHDPQVKTWFTNVWFVKKMVACTNVTSNSQIPPEWIYVKQYK